MFLIKEQKARIVYVGSIVSGWPHQEPMLSIMATVPMSGDWPEFVDIRCVGTDGDLTLVNGPWMKGRDRVPFPELAGELRETLREREQVIAAAKSGRPGPYRFARSIWGQFDPLTAAEGP